MANIVVEATGAAINSSQAACAGGVTAGVVDASGPFGYLAEGARTNMVLQSKVLSASWDDSASAPATYTHMGETDNQYVALDGTTTMDKIFVKATNFWHAWRQPNTVMAAGVTTASAQVRYVNNQWFGLAVQDDAANYYYASFDLLNGVVGSKSGSVTSSAIYATALSGVYIVSMTFSPGASSTAALFDLIPANADRTGQVQWQGVGTEAVGVTDVQLEAGAFASSPIPTTTAAVTRNADVLTYPSAGNISGTQGSAYAEVTSIWTGTSAARHDIVGSASGTPLYVESSAGKLSFDDGTPQLGNVLTGAATLQKVASSWSGAVGNTFIGGVASASLTFDGDMSMTTNLQVGCNNSLTQWDGTIRFLRIYPVMLPASKF